MEESSVSRHFFIDPEKNELIFINDEIDDDVEKKLNEMGKEKYISIPERVPKDDFLILELFVYKIVEDDFNRAEEFYKVLDGKKPFRRFRELLEKYPELKEKWFKFRENEIKNEAINWLCENNIVLDNQRLVPEIEIKELGGSETAKLPEEVKDFGPIECMDCKNHTGIRARYFVVNQDIENMLIDREVRRIMEEKYKIKEYGMTTAGDRIILTASRCPKCGSNSIFWDF